ncbi:hypothetical protein DM01DRAFT_1312720 [Hesseltinella vesiculosa]|uniref:Tethering factor for nuclear proteasome STS1 n=1 Tax=Hesseltinella vesiculosa TaxID=101127 RepID=A0A1X2G3P6_9FUNG|nr:hypothetical protein DM01DRAFT_1312720 [Hesseltinella vesiculosa]
MASAQNNLFRQQQQLYRSSHYMNKSKQPLTSYTPPPTSTLVHKGRKRRASEDEEMTMVDLEPIEKPMRVTKRQQRTQKAFPLPKLLATLEKDKLIDLIHELVDAQPDLQAQVDAHLATPAFNPAAYRLSIPPSTPSSPPPK